jgi:CTP synthase
MHDCESIYIIPNMLRDAGYDFEVIRLLNLDRRINLQHERQAWLDWSYFVDRLGIEEHEINIGITGKYTSVRDSYASIIHALEHSGIHLATKVNIQWIDTTEITENNVAHKLKGVHGIIVPGGFGSRGAEGKIECVRYVRENEIPYLGICFGFQMAVIEFARHVCGIEGACSSEINPSGKNTVIDILPEQKKIEGLGGNMRLGGKDILLEKDTQAWHLFGKTDTVRMRFRHRLEVDPAYIDILTSQGLVFSGKAPNHPIMQIMELPSHPYFLGTQAHPCMTSRPLHPQPMFVGLVAAARKQAYPEANLPNALAAMDLVRNQIQEAKMTLENHNGRRRKQRV